MWVLSKMSFAGIIDGSFGYTKSEEKITKKVLNSKINIFNQELIKRLENVQLENTDALRVIRSRDTVNTFHFVDPPYVGSEQGHYKGYTEDNFTDLLNVLKEVTGKFMLTMYPNDVLDKYIKEHNWNVVKVERLISAARHKRRKQIELIVMNYTIS